MPTTICILRACQSRKKEQTKTETRRKRITKSQCVVSFIQMMQVMKNRSFRQVSRQQKVSIRVRCYHGDGVIDE